MYTFKYRKVCIYEVVNVDEGFKVWVVDFVNCMCDNVDGIGFCLGVYLLVLKKFSSIIKSAYKVFVWIKVKRVVVKFVKFVVKDEF